MKFPDSPVKWFRMPVRNTITDGSTDIIPVDYPGALGLDSTKVAELAQCIKNLVNERNIARQQDCPVMTHLHATKLDAFFNKYPSGEVLIKRSDYGSTATIKEPGYRVSVSIHNWSAQSKGPTLVLTTLAALNLFESTLGG